MPRSGTRAAVRGIDLRALRARRDAVPVSNAYSSEHPDPGVLVEAQTAASKVASGDWAPAFTILSACRSSLGQGRPALTIVERAVIDKYGCDRNGEVIEGFARRYLTQTKTARRSSPQMARATYDRPAVIHLRKGRDEKGRFESFCGRTFWPIPVRRGSVVASQMPREERPAGMEGALLCRRCAGHLDKLPDVLEPVCFPVLEHDERRLLEQAALHAFCAHPDGLPGWRIQGALAGVLQQIACARMEKWSTADFDRLWLRDVLGLRNGFYRAYGEDLGRWPKPTPEQIKRSVEAFPAALVLDRPDEIFEASFRLGHDTLIDGLLPPLLASCWLQARDACGVKDESAIEAGVLGDMDRRLRTILSGAGRTL